MWDGVHEPTEPNEHAYERRLQRAIREADRLFEADADERDATPILYASESSREKVEAALSSEIRHIELSKESPSETRIVQRLRAIEYLSNSEQIDQQYLTSIVKDADASGAGVLTESVICVLYRRALLGWIMGRLPLRGTKYHKNLSAMCSRYERPEREGELEPAHQQIEWLLEEIVARTAWRLDIHTVPSEQSDEAVEEMMRRVTSECWNRLDHWSLTKQGYLLQYCVSEGVDATNIDLTARDEANVEGIVSELCVQSLRRVAESRLTDYLTLKVRTAMN